jgi:hypothetical protein
VPGALNGGTPFGLSLSKPGADTSPFGLSLSKPCVERTRRFDKLSANG